MILLQVVTASAKLHNSEALKPFPKALSGSRDTRTPGLPVKSSIGLRNVLEHDVLSPKLNSHPSVLQRIGNISANAKWVAVIGE
jgi:hypothetical protein